MNTTILKGNLCKDIDLTFLPNSNTAVTRNTIAVKRNFKNSNGEYESDFINITAFGKTAEYISNYLNKGSSIVIQGNIRTGSYQKEDGTKVYTTEVVVEHVEPCGSRPNNQQDNYDNSMQVEDYGDQPF